MDWKYRKRFSKNFLPLFVGGFLYFAYFTKFVPLLIFTGFAVAIYLLIIKLLSPIDIYLESVTQELHTPLDESFFKKEKDLLKVVRYRNHLIKDLHVLSDHSEKINEQSELIFKHLEDGVLIVNKEFLITDYNEAVLNLLGSQGKFIKGISFSQLPKSELTTKCKTVLHQAMETKAISSSDCEWGKLHLELIAIPIARNEGTILLLRDYSSHVKIQEMGKDFIANASHELRTPITIIKGFAETLKDLPEISGAMLEDIMEKILRNCERMDQLVKNLLLLADIDYLPRSRLRPCDAATLMESCIDHVLAVYPQAHIQLLGGDSDVNILADPDLFELAIMNLLQNGVKYSKDPAKIFVSLHEKDNKVEITIRDLGIGIPEKELDHIFDRFYTVDKAHSRKLGGAGLGLSIVKNIIDKHDGSISVDSSVGIGTTFTIALQNTTH